MTVNSPLTEVKMPLSKERNRERMRIERSVQPSVQPKEPNVVQPNQAKIAELRELISKPQHIVDRQECTLDIDADGNPMPEDSW